MKVETKYEKGCLTATILGEIDHHSAKGIREKIDEGIQGYQPKHLILDYQFVNFMDSSGIGLIMGRYKLLQEKSGQVSVVNVSNSIYRVIQLSNLDKFCCIKKRGE